MTQESTVTRKETCPETDFPRGVEIIRTDPTRGGVV